MELCATCFFSNHFNIFLSHSTARHNSNSMIGVLIKLRDQVPSLRRRWLLTRSKNSFTTDLNQLLQRLKGVAASVKSAMKCYTQGIGNLNQGSRSSHVDGSIYIQQSNHYPIAA